MSKTTSGLPPLSEGDSHATTITDWSWKIIDTFLGADGGAENSINERNSKRKIKGAMKEEKRILFGKLLIFHFSVLMLAIFT